MLRSQDGNTRAKPHIASTGGGRQEAIKTTIHRTSDRGRTI